MTVTDVIYGELLNGLKTGLDYDQIRLKWEKSKGPFYNALQMVFVNAGVELGNLHAELNALQEKKVAGREGISGEEVQRGKRSRQCYGVAVETRS